MIAAATARHPLRALRRIAWRGWLDAVLRAILGTLLLAIVADLMFGFRLRLSATDALVMVSLAVVSVLALWTILLVAFGNRLMALRLSWLRAARRARNRSRILERTLDSVGDGILMVDGRGRIRVINRRARDLLEVPGDRGYNLMPVSALAELLAGNAAENRLVPMAPPEVALNAGGPIRAELRRANGRRLDVETIPLDDGGYVRKLSDVTQQRLAEEQVLRLATHDTLTELPNRRHFQEALTQATLQIPAGGRFAVHVLDLDRFKSVNDTLGHPIGDELLRIVGARLRSALRQGDVVARLGGDEFAVLQSGAQDQGAALALAERLSGIVSRPYEIGGHQIIIDSSVGVTLAPDDGDTRDALMRYADLALYAAKAAGRGKVALYKRQMIEQVEERRRMEADLRAAIGTEQLLLNYQPILSLATGRVDGFEALLRWHHPSRGLVSPADFIPIAEESGLIGPIGSFVIARATRDAANWPDPLKVAVNISPAELQFGDVVATARAALSAAGLAPERLEIELTETAILHSNAVTRGRLDQLKAMGLTMSMDDFGTGYSSLSYLRTFPFDKIKIDRCFVAEVGRSRYSTAIIETVCDLARRLGIRTTAEGIETEAQRLALAGLGCDQGQGYHFARPMPVGEVAAYITRQGISGSCAGRAPGPHAALTAGAGDAV